jgi:acyl-CoA synthetase (AMP-forming)/AMP-acid ligase II
LKQKRLNSIGRSLPDVEIKVRDDAGKFLRPNEVGEIIIRTPRIMKGYAGRADENALPEGWRATGDLGWVDEGGYVFFAGRKDDMIIRGGENIAPAEIEAVLMSHPAVDEAAVIGVPSVEWGQTVKAYVVLRPGQKSDATDIQEFCEFCRTRLASFKRPEHLEFLDALPKNALGKILHKELHAREKGATA